VLEDGKLPLKEEGVFLCDVISHPLTEKGLFKSTFSVKKVLFNYIKGEFI
jgi:hypothetical protein